MSPRRIEREKRTVEVMITMFCRDHHGKVDRDCQGCQGLTDYALARLDACPHREDKPTCSKCLVHCYRPEMMEKMREVIRHSGPRMLTLHPVLALGHLVDGLRRPHK